MKRATRISNLQGIQQIEPKLKIIEEMTSRMCDITFPIIDNIPITEIAIWSQVTRMLREYQNHNRTSKGMEWEVTYLFDIDFVPCDPIQYLIKFIENIEICLIIKYRDMVLFLLEKQIRSRT